MRGLLPHLGVALIVSAPGALHPLSRLVGDPRVDVWNHAWGPWWFAASLREGQLPWQTRYLRWPDGGALWFIDPLLGAMGAPIAALGAPVLAYNLVIFIYLCFSSWAGARLAQALGVEGRARLAGSIALTASAWVASELHNGISEALDIGPVALALAWGIEAARRPGHGRWAKAGAAVGLATLASPYLGLGTGLAMLMIGLGSIRHAWLGALVAAALAAPPSLLLRLQLSADDAIVRHPEAMNEALALHNAVDPRVFIAPFGFRSVDLSAEGFEHSMYLGLVALGLALYGLWSGGRASRGETTRLLAAGFACAILALGPYLYWGDGWLLLEGGRRLRLPWWAAREIAPGLALTHPLRLAVPSLALVAGLAARGAARLPARWITVALGLLLLDGLVLSGAPWPVATAEASPPAALAPLRRALGSPLRGAVLDLPTDAGATMATSRPRQHQRDPPRGRLPEGGRDEPSPRGRASPHRALGRSRTGR